MGLFSFTRKQKRPDNMLPAGWQFYSRPNNLEQPGTIFRIDSEGKRFIVERLKPEVERGPEPGASKTESIEAKVGVLARFIGIEAASADVSGSTSRTLEFQLTSPVRESTTDLHMDAVLKPFLAHMELRPKNRYFVVREVRTATEMKFRLTDGQLGEIGGKAAMTPAITAGAKLSAKSGGVSELTQAFPERLGVMFLPEEIAPLSSGLGGRGGVTELGRVPVTAALDWVDAKGP